VSPTTDRPTSTESRAESIGLALASGDVLPMTHAAGLLAAVQAAAASLVVVLAPVVLTWVTGGGDEAGWLDVVRLAAALWLLAQHGGLAVDGGHLGLVPLGLACVPVLACGYAGARLARSLDPRAERIASGATRAAPSPAPRRAVASLAVGHGAIGLLAGALGAGELGRPVLWQAFAGPAVVGAIGASLGSLAYVHGGARAGVAAAADLLPAALRRYLSPVAAALAVQLAAGALGLLAALVLGAGRVLDLYQALGGGVLGAVMVTLLQLALLPNLVIWAASALAGPGFAVGAGSEVSPLTSTLGPLPALPVLGALPDPGPMPGYAIAVVAVGVIAGLVAGNRLLRLDPLPDRAPWLGALIDVVAVAAGSGLAFALLAWLGAGPAGPGRLAQVGPVPHLVGAAVAIQVLVGAALLVLVRRGAPALADAVAERRGGYRRGS